MALEMTSGQPGPLIASIHVYLNWSATFISLQIVSSWPNSLSMSAEHLPEAQLAIQSYLCLTDFPGKFACSVGEDTVHEPKKVTFDKHEAVG